ncbi:hypothetical protein [Nocardia sp. NPDC056100]|uniref:hypothetical protein n=1 Tax=Nocardia sp. NPDC056100 TaxID=3345712 RepID=UPI0035DDFF54
MTEDRNYGDGVELVDDFRRKLNSYLGAVRSGAVRRMAKEAGIRTVDRIEIVLFSATEPPSAVFEMMNVANSSLERESISVRWESLRSNDIGTEAYERAIVSEAAALLAPGWKVLVIWVSLAGNDGDGGIQVERADGVVENVELSNTLRGLLIEHKRATYDVIAGAWLSGRIESAASGPHRAGFSRNVLPDWVPMPSATDIRQELVDYPRATDRIPAWMREQIG